MDEIEVFVAVVEANSFIKAAQRLKVPASTVSARVAKLEERLGVTLIRRTTRQVHVTAAGHAYYCRCLNALAEMGEAEREIAATREEPAGLLRIMAPSEMAAFLLPRYVAAYLDRYPKALVEMVATAVPFDRPGEGIDLAIQLEPRPSSRLVVRPLQRARLALWASPAYLHRRGTPRIPDDLQDHELIRFTRTEGDFALRPDEIEGITHGRACRLATDDFHCLLGFILGGLGIGPLPDFMGRSLSTEVPLTQVLPDTPIGAEAQICLVHPAQTFVPADVRAFIAVALEGAAEDGGD